MQGPECVFGVRVGFGGFFGEVQGSSVSSGSFGIGLSGVGLAVLACFLL